MAIESAILIQQDPIDLIRYRNYLLNLWTRRYGVIKDAAIADLNRRFHQDFETMATELEPADDLVNKTLTEILVAAGDANYGFEIPPSTIAPRGGRTSREYQAYLIKQTRLSAREISLRYRLDIPRVSDARSCPVIENITTLLGFYRDSFQCDPEEFPIIPIPGPPSPPAVPGRDPNVRFRAPFFLEFGEWIPRNRTFYGENYYEAQPILALGMPPGYMYSHGGPIEEVNYFTMPGLEDLKKRLSEGRAYAARGLHALASESYLSAQRLLLSCFEPPLFVAAGNVDGVWQFRPEVREAFANRKAYKVRNLDNLRTLTDWFAVGRDDDAPIMHTQWALVHLAAFLLPILLGDLSLAVGDYAGAVHQYLHTFDPTDRVGLANMNDPGWDSAGMEIHYRGDVPYTYDNLAGDRSPKGDDRYISWHGFPPSLYIRQDWLHPLEKRLCILRLGNALLEWADALYRRDDPASMARARELFKAVFWLHDETPPVCPSWDDPHDLIQTKVSDRISSPFRPNTPNPAVTSQIARARLGFDQLEAGLNYYGFAANTVPTLRYRPLKDAADRLAAMAKSTQADFLLFVEKSEELAKESIQAGALLKKANLLAGVADEQIDVAERGVAQAENQEREVLAAIHAKEDEIAKKGEFFSQLGDYVSGMIAIVGKVSSAGIQPATGDPSTGDSKEITGVDLGVTTLEGGGAIMAGFAAFWVASYLTVDGMANASNRRFTDLTALRDKALPAAEEQIALRKRSVAVAHLQKEIAQADADLANDLLHFQSQRFLNPEFWAAVAAVMRRILRRYLELGARTAWLAERALVYELDLPMDLVRLDYFPVNRQGIPGADLLQADLVELEEARLEAYRRTVPIKHSFSLARDFPLQFGQLKQHGRCVFRTSDMPLVWSYPGTYAHRIRAVTVVVQSVEATPAVRGLLTNVGMSVLTHRDGSSHASLRPPDALPLSEFRMLEDLTLYSLPDESLLPFEGSGIDTFWSLEFPLAANPYGLGNVADVLMTVHLRAAYSPELQAIHAASVPKTVNRLVFLSAQRYQAEALASVRDPAKSGSVKIAFDLTLVGLPKSERTRTVQNLVLYIAGTKPFNFTGVVGVATPPLERSIPFINGVALSNADPAAPGPSLSPAPLNEFIGASVDQTFQLTINLDDIAAESRSHVVDIVLGIDYRADLAA
jgi:hypothetical protein